jgi:hypothetical protein
MQRRRFTPAFDSLSLRIAPSTGVVATAGLSTVPMVAAATASLAGASSAVATSASTAASSLDSSPYTCAVPTTAADPYLCY